MDPFNDDIRDPGGINNINTSSRRSDARNKMSRSMANADQTRRSRNSAHDPNFAASLSPNFSVPMSRSMSHNEQMRSSIAMSRSLTHTEQMRGRNAMRNPNVAASMHPNLGNMSLNHHYSVSENRSASARTDQVNFDQIRELVSQGFPTGLAMTLAEHSRVFNERIWVVDNSGSMQIGDGRRIVPVAKKNDFKSVPSTRWEEIQDTVQYHAEMAALLETSTLFKLLNDPGSRSGVQEFSVAGNGKGNVSRDIQVATSVMKRTKPSGVTPLTRHIWEIYQKIADMVPRLESEGRKVVVVLATDGLPTDEEGYVGDDITSDFINALRALQQLPCWVVVRLCTNEEKVTEFYNSIDTHLEFSLDVLDDFVGEAEEVYTFNKWINYAMPMHRCREMGYHDRVFDLIDERSLTKEEVHEFCCSLLGINDPSSVPDPSEDWVGFLKTIQTALKNEPEQWNPIKKKMMPWISLKTLHKIYGDNSQCSIM